MNWRHERGVVAIRPNTRGMVEYCPILFAMRGACVWGPNGPYGARLDSAKFARDLKVGRIFPAVWKKQVLD